MYKKITEYSELNTLTRNGSSVEHNIEFIKGLEQVCSDNIPGDFFDIGSWTGTVSFFAAVFFKLNNINKRIYLFDTFDGHPPKHKTDKDDSWRSNINDYKDVNTTVIVNIFNRIGYSNYELVKGDIFDTLPKFKDHPISFASLDLNYYAPTKFALQFLQTNNFKGTIFEDDYQNIDGITNAFDESIFVKKHDKLNSVRGGFFKL